MRLCLNGRWEEPPGELLPLERLLEQRGYARAGLVVEHNGEVLPPAAWADALLREGDRLELVRFVGGG